MSRDMTKPTETVCPAKDILPVWSVFAVRSMGS